MKTRESGAPDESMCAGFFDLHASLPDPPLKGWQRV